MLSNQGSSHIRRMPNGGQTPKIYDTFSGKPDDVSAESGPVKGLFGHDAGDPSASLLSVPTFLTVFVFLKLHQGGYMCVHV